MLKNGFPLLIVLLTLGAVFSFRVKFQWNYVNYTWWSAEQYNQAKIESSYIERNNVISGIKAYKDHLYITIPRWKRGVPVTLASVSATPTDGEMAPLLEPFPHWGMQKVGDCRALQFVQNVEIDPMGRMWVLDSGRVMDGSHPVKCPPKLYIFDLEDSDRYMMKRYDLPTDVADPKTSYLYDIVLEHEDGGVAYISDADAKNPGIIVFSLKSGIFWKMSHSSTAADANAVQFNVGTVLISEAFNIHGLALSPASTDGNRTLYYSPLSSFHVYSISTSVLKNEALRADVNAHVRTLGRKPSQTDGMAMSNTGVMYYGLLADDAVARWDSRKSSFVTGQRIISRDRHLMQWPTSFAFDNNGTIWCITNRLHMFLNNSVSIEEPNFRVLTANVSSTNYQYLPDGSVPHLPEIEKPMAIDGAVSLSSHTIYILINLVQLALVYLSL